MRGVEGARIEMGELVEIFIGEGGGIELLQFAEVGIKERLGG